MGLVENSAAQQSSYFQYRKMSSEEVQFQIGKPRDDLINTAVKFLTNPNIQSSANNVKEHFLKKKGLTDEEVKLAFERASIQFQPQHSILSLPLAPPLQPAPLQISLFQKVRDILNTIALVGGLAYVVYQFYKKYIAVYLFGKPKKPKSVEDSLQDLDKTVKSVKSDLVAVQNDVERVLQGQQERRVVEMVSELKAEMTTVKGLLLNRHQFPSVNLSSTSIPAWQLTSSNVKEGEDIEHGSGSSETEIVQKPDSNGGSQGSDSSLEMIKEVES